MSKAEEKSKTLPERLQDQVEAFLGRLRDAVEELVAPPPEPVRIPVRSRYRR